MKFLENISPRDYQKKIFETCSKENCLVVLPTGLGKTLIALMLTINRIEKFPMEKVLFLAPTKPLIEQHLEYFKKHLPPIFATLELFTGAVDAEKRKKLWEDSDIIFSTPQCISNDLKKGFYNLNEVSLLIEDEAHRCAKNYSYNYIAEKYSKQAKHQRIFGATASPGNTSEKIKEICKNLFIKKIESRTRDSEDVAPYLQKRELQKVFVKLPSEMEEMRGLLREIFEKYISDLKRKKLLFRPATKGNLIKLQGELSKRFSISKKNYNYLVGVSICAQAIKLHHGIELLETQTIFGFNEYFKRLYEQAKKKQSKGVIKLVSNPSFNLAFIKSNELLSKKIEHPKIKEVIELIKRKVISEKNKRIIIFSQFRDTVRLLSEELNKFKGIRSKIFVGQTKIDGVGLNQKEQKKILQEFSEGEVNVLCSTSVGEEGLDIPEVEAVIFYEPIPSAIRSIQRAGRTARVMKGEIIIFITKGTQDEAYFYLSQRKEKKINEIMKTINSESLTQKRLI